MDSIFDKSQHAKREGAYSMQPIQDPHNDTTVCSNSFIHLEPKNTTKSCEKQTLIVKSLGKGLSMTCLPFLAKELCSHRPFH
jgi:hypothetical protein